MTVVAVAGGAASIGRSFVEEIVRDGKFEVIVLSRKENAELEKTLGARILAADYTSIDSLITLLEANNVHTLVSALSGVADPDSEQNLIQAAEKSNVTKRYIPAAYGGKWSSDVAWFPIAGANVAKREALQRTELEWTFVHNGIFADYWGMPKIRSYLMPMVFSVDMEARKAGIPGSGAKQCVFTYTADVARFLAKLLTLDKWEEDSYIIGDKMSFNDFVKTAEEVCGEKFDVVYDSMDLLKAGKITELPGQVRSYPTFPKEELQKLLASLGIVYEQGFFDLKPPKTLNDMFPEIKPTSVKEVMEIGWKN